MTVRDGGLEQLLDWLVEDRAVGRTAGLVPLFAMTMPEEAGLVLHPSVRGLVDGAALRVLCHGERVHCGTYRRLPGQDVPEPHRYLPVVEENGRRILAPGQVPADQV